MKVEHMSNKRRKTPYGAVLLTLDEVLLEKLGIVKIKLDEVNLSPKLLKAGDK